MERIVRFSKETIGRNYERTIWRTFSKTSRKCTSTIFGVIFKTYKFAKKPLEKLTQKLLKKFLQFFLDEIHQGTPARFPSGIPRQILGWVEEITKITKVVAKKRQIIWNGLIPVSNAARNATTCKTDEFYLDLNCVKKRV